MTKVLVEIVFDTDNKPDVEKEIEIILSENRNIKIDSFNIMMIKD